MMTGIKPKSQFGLQLKKESKKSNGIAPLALLVVTSLLLAALAISELEWEDHVSIRKGFLLFAYGLVFFTSLFNFLNILVLRTAAGQKIIRTYNLTKADILDISNKEVSAIQAFFCCMTGATVCMYSCRRDMLKTSHFVSEAYAWFGAAYFFYDIWSMYKVHIATPPNQHLHVNGDGVKYNKEPQQGRRLAEYLKNNAVIVMHHLFIGCFGFIFITYLRGGLGDCFFGFVYLMEASTPFVSLRGVLSKIGMKSSNLYIVNGLLMLAVFFICRVAMFPYVIYLYARSVGLDFVTAVTSLPMGCKVSISILLYPQIYWFYLMMRGATRVLKPKIINKVSKRRHHSHSPRSSHS